MMIARTVILLSWPLDARPPVASVLPDNAVRPHFHITNPVLMVIEPPLDLRVLFGVFFGHRFYNVRQLPQASRILSQRIPQLLLLDRQPQGVMGGIPSHCPKSRQDKSCHPQKSCAGQREPDHAVRPLSSDHHVTLQPK